MTEKKIKLFVDAHVFDKEFQGTQTFVHGLYSALLEKYSAGLEVYFGAKNVEAVAAAFPAAERSRILPYKKNKSDFLRLIRDIPDYIRRYQFDFAHFQNISLQQNPVCRSIVTLHDVLYDDFPREFPRIYRQSRNFLFKRSIRHARVKTSVSAYSRDRIAAMYQIDPADIHIVPNAADGPSMTCPETRSAAALFIKEKFGLENFILSVGRLEPRKNHFLLLSKYLQLGIYKKNIPLVFIGKKSLETPALQNLIEGMDSEQQKMFRWHEQVSGDELIRFYRACRLFVYPSKAEGFGIPPLEAAVCGAPVLCSNATAMRAYAFFNPFVFDPENESDFEEKLRGIIERPPDQAFIEAVAAKVRGSYSWKQSAAIFYDLLIENKK
jgi:glycosyltransferase involved in cell wall biosynthesis